MAVLATMPATIRGAAATFVEIKRNRGELTSLKRPALVLYDGVEAVEDAFLSERKSARATRLVTMSPRIAIILDDREPQNDLTGEDLNANIHTITNAIEADADLAALVGPNGAVQYVGIDSELEWNRTLEGLAVFTMAITYVRRHEPPTV
jgi:hypothetical protein